MQNLTTRKSVPFERIEKIKAEIQKYQDPTKKDCQFDVALNLCLKIIDKYTREV